MPFILGDRVRESSTTIGTGTLSLAGAASGFQTFVDGIGSGNNTYYCITDGTSWEIGIGTVTSGTPSTLSRDTVLQSSAGGATKVNWPAGTRDVFCTLPASRTITPDQGLPDGSAAVPALEFASDPNTGIYSPGADQFGISTAGSLAALWNASNQYLAGGLGTALLPIFSFNGDPNTGLYSPAADQLAITTGGVARATWNASNQYLAGGLGTAALPAFSFAADPNNGIYSPTTDQLAVATNGTTRVTWNTSTQYLSGSLGTAALPIFSFAADNNTGAYSPAADQFGISTAGSVAALWNASNQYLAGSGGTAALPIFSFNGDPNTGLYSIGADQLGVSIGGTLRTSWLASGTMLQDGPATTTFALNDTTSALEIRGAGEPCIAFHLPGLVATKMGINSAGNFAIGGWSWPASRLVLDGSGNLTVPGWVTAAVGSFTGAITVGGAATATGRVSGADFAGANACRAFARFNGTGVVAINSSYNVSSITDLGTGAYYVNFATAMPDANYSWQVTSKEVNDSSNDGGYVKANNPATGGLAVYCRSGGGSMRDDSMVCVHIF